MILARKKACAASYCLQCGGPTDPASLRTGRCAYCTAPLIPLDQPDPRKSRPCPRCTAAVSEDSHYCSKCGSSMDASTILDAILLPCAGCKSQNQHHWQLGEEPGSPSIIRCGDCGGSFVSHATLDALVTREQRRFEQQYSSSEDPSLATVQRFELSMKRAVEYRDCPHCQTRMLRKNYGQLSGVIVDQCHAHGVYFDAGELDQILAFVRSGGLAVKQARHAKSLARQKSSETDVHFTMTKLQHRDQRSGHWLYSLLFGSDGLVWALWRWLKLVMRS